MRRALRGIRRAGDSVWEARALASRGVIHLARGALANAENDIARAEELFQAAGQELEAVDSLRHRGLIAFCRGDIPRTLSLYDEAARRYAPISPAPPELAFDRCAALMAAGLPSDALEVVEQVLAESAIQPRSRAELLLAAGNAALAADDPAKALIAARKARLLFRRQGREWWEMRADLVIVRARRDSGEHGSSLLKACIAVGERMHELRTEDAPHALLLAGRFAAEQGSESAHGLLSAAARYKRNPSALIRATGWLAQAVDREASGDPHGVFAACSRGLDALDEHRMSLGSSELRALATGHGEELANLALREAVLTGDARRLLTWSERWRATALTQPPVRPPREARLASQLATLRSQSLHLDGVRAGNPAAACGGSGEVDSQPATPAPGSRRVSCTGSTYASSSTSWETSRSWSCSRSTDSSTQSRCTAIRSGATSLVTSATRWLRWPRHDSCCGRRPADGPPP